MAYLELELTEEAEKLGVSKIACNEGLFIIVCSGKEYSYAFPSAVWDKNQQAILEYLYHRILDGHGDGNANGPITEEAAISISNTLKQQSNWELVEEHIDTLENEGLELDAKKTAATSDNKTSFEAVSSTRQDKEQELINTPVTAEGYSRDHA